MFTGIIEEVGAIKGWPQANCLHVACQKINHDLKIGDSVAVNGVCLTIKNFDQTGFQADVSQETQSRWYANNYRSGCAVNLERAILASGRLGGHFVQGHVDGVGLVKQVKAGGDFFEIAIELNRGLEPFVAEKGSIAIEGISLTVNYLEENVIYLMIIPHTYRNTVLSHRLTGSYCNIEVDILAKYVARLQNITSPITPTDNERTNKKHSPLERDFFLRAGFHN